MEKPDRDQLSLPVHRQTGLEELERYKHQARQLEAEKKKEARERKRWKRVATYVLAGLAYLPAQFVAQNADYLIGSRDTLAPDTGDCFAPPEYSDPEEPTPEESEALEEIEEEIKDVQSNATQFRPQSRPKNTGDRSDDILLVPWNFDHVLDEFTMETSGINITVRTNETDSGILVNREAVEFAFNETMMAWDTYTDESARDFFYCAKVSLLDNKERAGTDIDILLPAKPNYCVNGMFAVNFADNAERSASCKNGGFSVPNLNYGILHPFISNDFHYLFVSGKSVSPKAASLRATNTLAHESAHQVMRLMDARPLLHPDEQLAEFADSQAAVVRDEAIEYAFEYPGA